MPTMPSTFRPPYMPTRQEQTRAGDRARGSAKDRGYDKAWSRASRAFLDKNVLCPACLAMGRSSFSSVTDHVIPHKGDRALFWDRSNWQACCAWHHNVVKQRLEALYQLGKIGAGDLVLTSAFALKLAARLDVGSFLALGEGG